MESKVHSVGMIPHILPTVSLMDSPKARKGRISCVPT